jgi:hypothetical protein
MHRVETRGIRIHVAAALAIFAVTGQAQNQPTRSQRAQDVLELLDAELVHVDLPVTVADRQLVALQASGFSDVLVLRPQAVRSPSYQLLVQRADGTLSISRGGAPHMFRGVLANKPGSVVSASLSDEGVFARIVLPDGQGLWLEPLRGRLSDAREGEYVLYEDEDVIESGLPCAVPVLAESAGESTAGESGGSEPTTSAGSVLKVAELACDADYEYYSTYGSVSAVEARIHSVVDAINLQYELQVGITHEVSTIIVRTSPSQPYNSTDPLTLLVEFRDEWNANHTGISRDVAHLFTGKQLDGNVIGIAYLGVICNAYYGYGLSQSDFSSSFASVSDLTAHELGHNWNANHCSCTSYTMNPYITASNAFEPTMTIPAIEAFRDSRTCLEESSSEPPQPPQPLDPEINLTNAESTSSGSVAAGSHLTTHDQDDVHEVLTEASSGGKPKNRRSQLSHTWSFDVQPGNAYTFLVDAHHTNNVEGDDFVFSYSLDGLTYLPMLTVTKTADDNVLQSYAFPADVSGTLFVRVEDTDRTAGNGARDSLYVDHLQVHTELDGLDTTPPSAPAGLVAAAGDATVSLDWDDSTASDLAGYNVLRSASASGPFLPVNPALHTASDWVDSSVSNGTTYHYTVTAVDLAGNESAQSASTKATPNVGGGGPVSSLVSSILVTAVSQSAGHKKGRADVWVVDELGAAVSGALVVGSFSGGLAETLAVVTDAQGLAVFVTSDSKKGSLPLTFCVDDVTHAALNYAPAFNVETCDVR